MPEAGGPEVIRGGGGARPEVLGVMPLLVGQHRHRAFCAVPARANRADILNIICGVRKKQTGESEAVGENVQFRSITLDGLASTSSMKRQTPPTQVHIATTTDSRASYIKFL